MTDPKTSAALSKTPTALASSTDWELPAQTTSLAHVGDPSVPSIGALTEAKGRRWVAVALIAELEKFARKMGFEARMTGEALVDAATHLRDELRQYPFEDVQLWLRGAALGKYGKFVYGNTAELLATWDAYVRERTAYAEGRSRRQAEEHAEEADEAARKVQSGYQRLRAEARAEQERKARKARATRARQDLRSRCNRDAVTLWSRATAYAGNRIPAADFIAALVPQDISDALFTVRRHRLDANP
jgi:hypothetical protein